MAQQKVFHIPSMHCSGCVMTLEGIEDDLPGILKIRGSYQKASLAVEWDETRLSEGKIIAAIRQLGYEVADR